MFYMNNQIFFFFYNLANQSKTFDYIVVFFAEYFPYLVIFIAGVFLLFHNEVFKRNNGEEGGMSVVLRNFISVFRQKKLEISLSFITAILAWVFAKGIKMILAYPRPFILFGDINPLFIESGYSFPSGHATFFMALAVSIFFFHKKAGSVFIFFAVLIGIARIISGIHFPVDILGGFMLGSLIAYLVKYVYNTYILCGKN